MGYMWLTLMLVCFTYGTNAATTMPPGVPNIPTGAAFDKLVDGSFKNVDSDKDGFIERYEFDTLIIVADKDNNGCMTLDEYKNFSAGGPQIATSIYQHFDLSHSNCLTVDNVSSDFVVMDADNNGMVTKVEFRKYYLNSLRTSRVNNRSALRENPTVRLPANSMDPDETARMFTWIHAGCKVCYRHCSHQQSSQFDKQLVSTYFREEEKNNITKTKDKQF